MSTKQKVKVKTIDYQYSVYDLNMAKTLKEDLPFALKNEMITNPRFVPEQFRDQIWNVVEMYCREHGLDYDYLFNAPIGVPIIIDSRSHRYFPFLEIALTFYDPFLISHFLTYQYDNFKGNAHAKGKLEFLGQVIFRCYDLMKLNSYNINLHRKEKIMDWLEEMNVKDLPKRFSMRTPTEDTRLKGRLTPEQILEYWLQLTAYKTKGKVVEVLNRVDIETFLSANLWGFNPPLRIRKLPVKNITQVDFKRFCKKFFHDFSESTHTRPFIKILKANFSVFDNTTEDTLAKNFNH